ncbi:FecR family protein [Peristeroidobacter soli]|uniref:FecR family protein n=1 Tax=Peristeroidobacter soli TaxID=2497877 RepID=UPI00101CFE34|nr:FecR domain-containing protein [Peristeroidobacter soli]
MSNPPSGKTSAEPRSASDWVAVLASKRASAEDLRALKAWLAADAANRREFDEARRLWSGIAPLEAPLIQSLPRRRPIAITAGLAAAACLVIAVFIGAFNPHDLVSPVGEVHEVPLADGSRLWLDSGAAVDFEQHDGRRTLRVARGRVHIVVAENEAPFVVEARDAVIRDIGTAFSVDVSDDELKVAVSEGLVEVSAGNDLTTLGAGRAARFDGDDPDTAYDFDVTFEAAWREGRVMFKEVPLLSVVRELGRYRTGKILVLDDTAGNRTVSGSVAIADIEGGLDSLANAAGVRLLRLPGVVIVHGAS